ncbi:PaaI family thioesterase [Qingshengfaniella alkalisoli]|uniref:PaaI family thioesterase n=1 Tax=Qingshengfaniella alkalisoli TaxID=2599296 RepID=A0A5B8J2R4_9RHOB|nr:PaaI family thioesterase [Qingshengfaniella alkalisoli]QDY68550.1 PaaI family thioesterase [Qingshengfaniella alkalisoli]
MSRDKAELAKEFISALPYARALGLELVALHDGVAELVMPYAEHLIGDPQRGVISGGAVTAMMDTAGGVAVLAHPEAGDTTATLDLRIDYMRGAEPGQSIRARAECYHVTRSVAFVRASAWDDDANRPIASAAGAFTVGRKSQS